ncbi:MAG TPA: hypothetical protein VF447_02000 [Terriglobales bacterium]
MKQLPFILLFAMLLAASGCGGGHFSSGPGSGSGPRFSNRFTAGIAHVSGNYGFTQNNYLVEGAQKISELGSDSIFIYLTPYFRSEYPDQSSNSWPASDPSNMEQLAQTKPYDTVFNLPFKTIVITAYSFANADGVAGISASPNRLQAEQNEFYALTKYFYSHFAGSGKTFILKNWEGDWIGLGQGNITGNISPGMLKDMIAWLTARQDGVTQARKEAGHSTGVRVFNAAEVNRVLDYAQNGMMRVVNAVIPKVNADMVSYSSYDSTAIGNDAQSVQSSLSLALKTIDKLAPDPMGLGKHRILISEYGLFENQLVGGTTWRASTILSTASKAGIYGAFLWNVFDNECDDSNGRAAPVDTDQGNPLRPKDNQCRGLWVVRPDGSTSSVVSVLKQYW